jgi:hypothetical protein
MDAAVLMNADTLFSSAQRSRAEGFAVRRQSSLGRGRQTMARYLSFYSGSATRVDERGAKQRATIVGFLIIATVTVLAVVVESRLTPNQHVQDFEQSPTYP